MTEYLESVTLYQLESTTNKQLMHNLLLPCEYEYFIHLCGNCDIDILLQHHLIQLYLTLENDNKIKKK